MFCLLRHLPWRSIIPNVVPSVNRKQTSIALVLVSHWRKDFLYLPLQRHSESVSIFFFVLDHSVPIVVKQLSSILLHHFGISAWAHSTTFVSFAVPIKQGWRSISSTFFQQLSEVFSISGFPQVTMDVFLLWVFLYRKVRERWVMQVPRCFCAHFFKNFCRAAYQNFSLVRWMKKYPQILVICNSSVFPLRSSIIKLQ